MLVLRKLRRLHIYVSQPLVSQPLVPVRGWVSMHPNLLHLQKVVAARCLSILSFSTTNPRWSNASRGSAISFRGEVLLR
jgi:hypothetical protein